MNRSLLDRISVVLADPKDSKNVGATCRAMKNMGLSSLVITGGRSYDTNDVKTLAVHAFDVFENAAFHGTLESALESVSFAAGISRRRGKFRKYHSLTPAALAERISKVKHGRIGLVFGNEEAGLSDEELALCNMAVSIPSSDEFPSLNLSHAVQVVAYEVFRAHGKAGEGEFSPVPRSRIDRLTGEVVGVLKDLGFFKQVTSYDMAVFFRDVFSRAMLDEGEADRISKVFMKIRGMCAKRMTRAAE